MKVNKVLTRFASAPEDDQELRRVARALGSELPRNQLEVVRNFRSLLARIALPEGSFAAGYVASMLDVAAEYEVHIRQVEDTQELERLALSEGWREVLLQLYEGSKLPSEIAASLGKDRPTITRTLKRLRGAGLVQAFANDTIDGRMRPHRLTAQGRRLLEGLEANNRVLTAELEQGIQVTVELFRHLVSHATTPERALDEVATAVLGDKTAAAAVVGAWVRASKNAGLITAIADGSQVMNGYRLTADSAPIGGRNEALWHQAPSLLTQLQQRKPEQVPVYVRTSDASFGAWAYTLLNQDTTGMSRAIVTGDILSDAVEPPDRRFDLVYDDPAAISADSKHPTMRAFMEQADSKFVVTTGDEDAPDGFIRLRLATEKE